MMKDRGEEWVRREHLLSGEDSFVVRDLVLSFVVVMLSLSFVLVRLGVESLR